MADSVFTKIIKGEIPCHKVYEDDKTFAFMDMAPITEGHLLIVPKQQDGNLWDVDDDLYQHLLQVAKKLANHQRKVLGVDRVGMMVDGFGVPDHAHIHVFPLYGGLEDAVANKVSPPSNEALAKMADKLQIK